jgi:hypothetical protein
MLEQGYPAHARSSQGLNQSVALAMHHGMRGMCSMNSSYDIVFGLKINAQLFMATSKFKYLFKYLFTL